SVQTDSSLTLPGLTASGAGTYAVQVTGLCNSVTNRASLTVNVPTTADALVSQTNCPGTTVAFSTVAHGTGPFTYQWTKDGAPISIGRATWRERTGITAGSAGTYAAVVT